MRGAVSLVGHVRVALCYGGIQDVSVADKWGQHEWGRCKSNEFCQIGEKVTPWHFWEDNSSLTGVPNKNPLSTNIQFAVTPISADPIRPFPKVSWV